MTTTFVTCSKCRKRKPVTAFGRVGATARRAKVCRECQKKRKERRLQWLIRNERCVRCGGPPTRRDIDQNGGKMERFRHPPGDPDGKLIKQCSDCLCPELTEKQLAVWKSLYLRSQEYHTPLDVGGAFVPHHNVRYSNTQWYQEASDIDERG